MSQNTRGALAIVRRLVAAGADPREPGVFVAAVSGGALTDIERPLDGTCNPEIVNALLERATDLRLPRNAHGHLRGCRRSRPVNRAISDVSAAGSTGFGSSLWAVATVESEETVRSRAQFKAHPIHTRAHPVSIRVPDSRPALRHRVACGPAKKSVGVYDVEEKRPESVAHL